MSENMSPEPRIVERTSQPYVAIREFVTMRSIGAAIERRMREVFGWLAGHRIPPDGPPFVKYNVIDMERELEIEVGVPVTAEPPVDGDLLSGTLPAGRYASVTHVGHPDGLVEATSALLDWAAERGVEWDVSDAGEGQRWGCRLEVYQTDPDEEPDMNAWRTDLVLRVADSEGARGV
jgi:effector-binding domain-containing protein